MAFYSSISPQALLSPATRQAVQRGAPKLVATLKPVDYDPFSATPVEYDPFATEPTGTDADTP
jgi:hypothetical protein